MKNEMHIHFRTEKYSAMPTLISDSVSASVPAMGYNQESKPADTSHTIFPAMPLALFEQMQVLREVGLRALEGCHSTAIFSPT